MSYQDFLFSAIDLPMELLGCTVSNEVALDSDLMGRSPWQ